MHQITIIGNLGGDAVVRETNGSKAINFGVAVNEKYQDKAGAKQEKTTWYDCTLWRGEDKAAAIVEYLKSGKQVYIQGKPGVRTYQDKAGAAHATLVIRVDDIKLLGRPEKKAGATTEGGAITEADDDNDLPF